MIGTTRRASAAFVMAVLMTNVSATPGHAQPTEKVTVGGWSQPISEITNLLAEPDKGFFKAKGIELAYVPGGGGGDAIRNMLALSPGSATVLGSIPNRRAAARSLNPSIRTACRTFA